MASGTSSSSLGLRVVLWVGGSAGTLAAAAVTALLVKRRLAKDFDGLDSESYPMITSCHANLYNNSINSKCLL